VPGELVALDLPRGPKWLEAVAGLWNSGVAILPLDDRLSASEHRRIVDLARPTWILQATGPEVFAGAPVDPGVGAVVATSGTGGRPKLAELSREALIAALTASTSALGIDASDPWVACLSPAHIGGLLVLLRGAVLGTPVVVQEGFDAASLVTESPEGAHVSLVPTMLRRLIHAGADLSRFGALLVARLHFEDDVVLVQLREDGRHLPLAEGVVQGVVDHLRRDAEPRGGVAVDRQGRLQATGLLIARHVAQLRQRAQLLDQLRRPGVQLAGIRRLVDEVRAPLRLTLTVQDAGSLYDVFSGGCVSYSFNSPESSAP
jgi:hypothetical protein